ncbi:hypothetical protein [Microbacterium oleivorans]|uniref:hypothetical protein n=1 Tax=Microbacterium oleivorans TaxID=273677 RepID=UPI0011461A25|nr:hypothetical protein [Microbacterium oleivorans]
MSDSWDASDDAAASIAGYGLTEPFLPALAFMELIQQDPLDVEKFSDVVTPESLAAWGDFSEAQAAVEAVQDWGMGSYPEPAADAPDVAYVKILRNEPEARQETADRVVYPALWLTLVWRPEYGMWLVHALGGRPSDPDDVPRSSPGVAPDYTRA